MQNQTNRYWVVATKMTKEYNKMATRIYATDESNAKKIARIEFGKNVKILSVRKEN